MVQPFFLSLHFKLAQIRNHPLSRFWVVIPFFLLVFFGLKTFSSSKPIDFYQFWLTGRAVSEGRVDNVYSPLGRKQVETFSKSLTEKSDEILMVDASRRWEDAAEINATPLLYAFFGAVSTGEFSADYSRFRIVSLIIFYVGFFSLSWVLRLDWLSTAALLLISTYFSEPFKIDVLYGNVNLIQFGGLAGVFFLLSARNRPAAQVGGGFLLALLCCFKPVLSFACLYLFIAFLAKGEGERIFSWSLGILAGLITAYLAPLLILGEACSWWNWVKGYEQVSSSWAFARNFFFLAYGTRDTAAFPFFVLNLFFLPLMIFYLKWVWKKENPVIRRGSVFKLDVIETAALGVGVGVFILFYPMVHRHYFVLLMPFILLLFSPGILSGVPFLQRKNFRLWHPGLICALLISLDTNPEVKEKILKFWGALGVYILLLLIVYFPPRPEAIEAGEEAV